MITEIEPLPETPPAATSRVAHIIRWAARLTSLPMLVLVLVSLLPTVISFSVSARDDKIIAAGLGGVCLGFLLAWLWPGVGGAISLASIGGSVFQANLGLASDPFTIAFALQAVLFLISSVSNLQLNRAATPVLGWFRDIAVALLVVATFAGVFIICRGPGPMPLPAEKARYFGMWDSGTGWQMEITKAGQAKVTQAGNATVAACNTPVKPGETRVFNAAFHGDDHLELAIGALGKTKVYLIEQPPHLESKQMKMTLNASDPYQPTNALILIRKE